MTRYRKLLVMVPDGHADSAALAQGIELAQRCDAELVVHIFDDRPPPKAGFGDAKLAEQMETRYHEQRGRWLDELLSRLHEQGIPVSGRAIHGSPVQEAMLADILSVNPDLVIKELKRESVLKRWFFTAEDWYLARLCPKPLLIVGQGTQGLPKRVLAAVDVLESHPEHHLNERLLTEALAFSAQTGAELHLAHVIEPVVDLPEDVNVSVTGASVLLAQESQRAREQAFNAFADAHSVSTERRHVALGRIDYALEDIAERIGAQLIVVGSNYRKGLDRLLLGATAEDLLAHAKQNVLVVKPEGFEHELPKLTGLATAA